MRLLAFDIEIAKIPESDDWKAERPLGITCAAVYGDGEREPYHYYGEWSESDEDGYRSGITERMDQNDCQALVNDLIATVKGGHHILTWNGLGFDFDILAEESGMVEECRDLALNHIDPMFQFHCQKGFPVGLDAVSKGMGLSGKTEGVDGSMAPQLWANGEYQTVLDYVGQDVKATLEVAQAIEAKGFVRWISRRGRPNYCPFPDGLLTVRECLELPEPDTSWMDSPLPRSRFTSWMEAAVNE